MDEMTYEDQLKATMERVLWKADKLASDAGQAGRRDDGGARNMRGRVQLVQSVLNEDVPYGWEQIWHFVGQASDPEWAEYQRLARKFSGEDPEQR